MGSMGLRRKTGLPFILLCFLVAGQEGAAETLYAKCSSDGDCAPPSKCIDYGTLYVKSGKSVKVCDCEAPTKVEEGEHGCSCAVATTNSTGGAITHVYRRWTFSKGGAGNPKSSKFTFPAADVTKEGCYLEMGEVCGMAADKNSAADPPTICRYKYYCKKLTNDYGLCHYGGDSALLLPSSVPVALLLLLHTLS